MKKGMEESYIEDLANRDGPVHALAFREGAAKRWFRGARRPAIEPRNRQFWGADVLWISGRQYRWRRFCDDREPAAAVLAPPPRCGWPRAQMDPSERPRLRRSVSAGRSIVAVGRRALPSAFNPIGPRGALVQTRERSGQRRLPSRLPVCRTLKQPRRIRWDLARSSPWCGSRIRLVPWVSGGFGCSGRVYRLTTTGACAASSSASACSGVGWVSFSNVLAEPVRRVVFRVWVASSARSVR